MDRWLGKIAVVTGASAGIGAGIAEALVREGLIVVGLARRLEKLEKLAESLSGDKGKFSVRRCDISKEQDLIDAFEWIKSEFGGIDILVNNAGVYSNKKITGKIIFLFMFLYFWNFVLSLCAIFSFLISNFFLEDDINGFRKILDTNVLATAFCTREAIASMKNRKVAGHIININR